MTDPPDALIDRAAIHAMMEGFDADTRSLLVNTAIKDIDEWSERLIASWLTDDLDERRSARHSLRGLCGNFGTTALMTMCDAELSSPEDRERLRACCSSSYAALQDAIDEMS